MKKLVVLSGAGISAESGLGTFRDKGGLWDEYPVEEVATYEAWLNNPSLVLDFYNKRREAVLSAKPNNAHIALAQIEKNFDVTIVTQNIDDLHERAGSKDVLHLHGQILLGKSSVQEGDSNFVNVGAEGIKLGDRAPDGSQLRPHVVWFGEPVPNIPRAEEIVAEAEILIIIGTSLNVYPAANLLYKARRGAKIYLVDKNDVNAPKSISVHHVKGEASKTLPQLLSEISKI
ncbi:MAG: NAD-dependent deacylase [Crocinitomicaceae bacterium]|nr:NAD-dependent deacylase [Crocinitomicaceae bacterium]